MKEKKKRFLFISVVFLWFLSFFSASGYAQDDISARLKAESDLPRTVAVLPFQNDTQDPDIAQQVRKAFYNHFSSKPYLV